MKRTQDEAFDALRDQIVSWARGDARADLRIFVYPPEWEAVVLARMPVFADQCSNTGYPVVIEDVGQGFLAEVDRRPGLIDRLESLDTSDQLHDLGWIGTSYLRKAIQEPLAEGLVCRIFVNLGALGTFVSYSSIANELGGEGSGSSIPATVLSFPGEGDERSLNLLRLRVDTSYRVARI